MFTSISQRFAQFLSAAIVLAAAVPAAIGGPITYTYIGNHYTSESGGLYSSTNSQIDSFTLAAALGPNLNLADITGLLQAWTFSDGIDAFTSSNSHIFNDHALFSTDASGSITQWYFEAIDNLNNVQIATINDPNHSPALNDYSYRNFSARFGANDNNAGVWDSGAPEPATVAMVPLAGALVLLMTRRRNLGTRAKRS